MATFYPIYQHPTASVAYYSQPQPHPQSFQPLSRSARRAASHSTSRHILSPAAQYRHAQYPFVGAPIVSKDIPDETEIYREKFEAARSFELEDDEIFCPHHLLTEDDLMSIYTGSDSSSFSSVSPDRSPLQMTAYQAAPVKPLYNLSDRTPSPSAAAFRPSPPTTPGRVFQGSTGPRKRNPIPIVDPASGKCTGPSKAVC